MRRALAIVGLLLAVLAATYLLWPRPDVSVSDVTAPLPTPVRHRAPLRAADEGYRLEGLVVDPAGKPVAGATVTVEVSGPRVDPADCPPPLPLRSCAPSARARLFASLDAPREQLQATSGPGGRFSFEHLGSAAMDLWAEADGFGPAYLPRAFPLGLVTLRLSSPSALSGQVLDEDGRAISGAEVRVSAPGLPRARTLLTAARHFSLTGLGAGPFTVIARKDGFLAARKVSDDGAPLTLTLVRPRVLLVRAHGADGPIAARAELDLGEVLTREITPDAPARFEGLYPGEWPLRATAPGLASVSRTVKVDANPTEVDLALVAGAPLSVTLIDERGGPVPEATVSLWPIGASPNAATQLKVPAGARASFGVVPRGRYRLMAQADGYDLADRGLEVRDAPVEVELTLARGVRIEGQVVDSVGRPVPGVMVSAMPFGEGHPSDADGHFTIRVPSKGRYQVIAHHSDWGGAEVSADAPAEGVLLRLDARAALEATVMSEDGPVAGVVLSVSKKDAPNGERFFTDRASDASGHIVLRGVPAGDYLATVSERRYLPPAPIPVTLVEGQTTKVQFTLASGARLAGVVHDGDGSALAGVQLELVSPDESRAEAKSDESGRFELTPLDPAKRYRLMARLEGYQLLLRYKVKASDGPLDLTLARSRVVSGVVRDPSGRPIEAIEVQGRRVDAPEGRFEASLDFNGSEEVVIGAAGYEWKTLKIGPGHVDLGEVTLTPARTLGGRVVDGEGNPLEGAIVRCDVCLDPSVSGADGSYQLASSSGRAPQNVEAELGERFATVDIPSGASAVPDLVLAAQVHVEGAVFGRDRRPAAGVLVVARLSSQRRAEVAVTDAEGRFQQDLSPGDYRFGFGDDPLNGPSVQARIEGEHQALTLGWQPGSQAVEVHLATPMFGELWLVPGGALPQGPLAEFKPPLAFVSPFRGKDIRSEPVPPGHYTAFVGEPYGPLLAGPAPVQVPGTGEVTLPTFAPAANSE